MSKVLTKCLIDLDGVLADFVNGAAEVHGQANPYNDKRNYGNYSMEKIWGITQAEFWVPMDEDFWTMLDVMPLAQELVDFLDKEFDGNICILSSPSKNRGCIDGKLAWIEKFFPSLKRKFLFGPEKQFCSSPNTLLVDDYDHNINKFREFGGHGYLVPRPWNSLHMEEFDIDDLIEFIDEVNYSLSKGR